MKNVPDRVQRAAMKLYVETGSTEISVSDLAREANVARTTIYHNVKDMGTLFADIASNVTETTNAELEVLLEGMEDPAMRLAIALRLPLRLMQQDRLAGLFVTRFALHARELKRFWRGVPLQALETGMANNRFDIISSDIPLVMSQMSGALLSIMLLVEEGHVSWRDAATGLAFHQLRCLGLSKEEARKIAACEMPDEAHKGLTLAI